MPPPSAPPQFAVAELAIAAALSRSDEQAAVASDIAVMTMEHDDSMLEEPSEIVCENGTRATPRSCSFGANCLSCSKDIMTLNGTDYEAEFAAAQPRPFREYLTPGENKEFLRTGRSPEHVLRACVLCERTCCAMAAELIREDQLTGVLANWFVNDAEEYDERALITSRRTGGRNCIVGSFAGPNVFGLTWRRAPHPTTGVVRWIIDQGQLRKPPSSLF